MHKVLLLFTHLTIVFSSCPPGWKEFSAQAGCYYIDLRPMAFVMAEQSCQEMQPDAHLLSIHNGFQNEMIREEQNRNGSTAVLWIGFNSISSAEWEWIDASPTDYLNKCPGFPTNTSNKCAKFIAQGCWQDADCSELSAYVCGISFPVQPSTPSTVIYTTTTTTVIQSTTTTTNVNGCSAGFTLMEDGYCYYASDIDMTFDDANRDCQERGAHLVSMHNYWENLIAMKFLLYAHEVLHRQANWAIWIGLQCHNASWSSCGWTDGSRFDYSASYYDYLASGDYWGVMSIGALSRGRWGIGGSSSYNRLPFVCKNRSSVGVPETSDNQLPNCNIGYWSADSNTSCYGFDSLLQDYWIYCDQSCVQIGGRCASIHSRQQNSDIYALFQTTQPPSDITYGFHIALKENGTTWYWVDGTPYDNSFWAPGYPLPGQTPYISAATNGLWATATEVLSAITQLSNNICPTAEYFGMGEIRSPGFPENYAFNRTCTYTLYDRITADPPYPGWVRTKLAVYFITFVTHPLDVVEIFDGPNVNSPLIASVSGIAGAKQEYYSTGTSMTVRFISRVGNGYKGWRAVFGPYTTRPANTTVIQPTTTPNANGCSDGFTLMEDGYCYYASDVKMKFDDANRDCQERGAHLVSMHNYWENLIAMKFLLYAHEVLHWRGDFWVWIGLQCHNASWSSCGWTDGSRFDYSAIHADYLNSGYYWGYMYIGASIRGRWGTGPRDYVLSFVCKHRSSVVVPETSDNQLPNCNIGYWSADSNTSCYGFDSLYQVDCYWCDAYCVQLGGRCASIHNQQQNSDIYALFQTTQSPSDITNGFHIGLKENGNWYWVDGTPYDNSFWAPGYPRPDQTPYVNAATNGLWATDWKGYSRSLACRQNPITQLSNSICPTAEYFGMGEIRSPGFPENYAFNRTCTYTLYDQITADPAIADYYRTKLAVYFITFVTHPLDVVEIFDGPNVNSPLIANVSGIAGAKQEYYSTGWNMTIRFISRVGNNFKGWRAVFGPYTTRP